MNIIERLKANKEAFGLMDKELREVAEKIGINSFEAYSGFSGDGWFLRHRGEFLKAQAYRLRADYKCQHQETHNGEKCLWCGEEVKPEPKMGWVEAKVVLDKDRFSIDFGTGIHSLPYLSQAQDYEGFGGVKYEAPCDCHHEEGIFVPYWSMESPPPCEQHGPWKPVAVRFWWEVAK